MAVRKSKYPRKADKNIMQTGDLSFRVRLMSHGHQIDKTFDTLPDAQAYRDLVRANAALDEQEARIFKARARKSEVQNFSFSDALRKYRSEKTELKKGAKQEGYAISRLLRSPLSTMPVYQITGAHIKQLVDWIKAGGKPASEATARRYLNLVRHVFQVAKEEWGKIDKNPCDDMPKSARPKDGPGRERRLKGDEYERLISALKGQAKIMVILAVETAMRRGEILAARWEHLDLKARALHIPDSKTGVARTVPLSLSAVEAFREIGIQGIKGKIITINARQLRHAWQKARTEIGAPDLRIHDLRHEATSRFFEKGMGDIEVMTMTGHKTPSMLKRYAHLKHAHILDKLDKKIS